MRTIRTKVYKFNELSKDVQDKVVNDNFDINVFFEWWDSIYEDAKNIGIKITAFDIDRGNYCKGEFINHYPIDVAKDIIETHGESCETYTTAFNFIVEHRQTVDEDIEELEEQFLKDILEDYRMILTKEFEYLTSEEVIKETIIANEYEFTKEGNRF